MTSIALMARKKLVKIMLAMKMGLTTKAASTVKTKSRWRQDHDGGKVTMKTKQAFKTSSTIKIK
jgi:hypothetical protein